MYWVDNHVQAAIYRSRLDGTDIQAIIQGENITRPSGLAIDENDNILYWCDQARNVIEKVYLTNMTRRIIVHEQSENCLGLAVDGNHIYWTDV
jgi:sugar lactone lactonase YvrE